MDSDSLFFRLLRLGLGIARDKGQGISDKEVVVSDSLELDSSTPLRFAQNDIKGKRFTQNDTKGKHFPQNDTKGRCFALDDAEGMHSAPDDTDAQLSIANCQLSIAQGVGAFIFDGLQKATEAGIVSADAVSREVKMKLFSHTMQVEKLCKSQYALAAELAGIYARNGIRTVVLKGIAAGTCYPNPMHRPCGDLDCFLFDKHEEGNRMAEEAGAKVESFHYKHSHINYRGLEVENHRFCTAVRGSRKMKRFERLLQTLLAEESTTRIGETHLENPSPLFNALFLTLHARNHLLLEGIALRHLCDWAMLLHKHGAEIDWKRFVEIVDEYGLRRFADAMTRLSKALLDVDIPAGYEAREDAGREACLYHEILKGLSHPDTSSGWQYRWSLIKKALDNKRRYELFSDISYLRFIMQLVYGFCFDRHPKL